MVSSAIIDKYIGESARLIREMFGYARDHQVRLLIHLNIKRLIFWCLVIHHVVGIFPTLDGDERNDL